MDCDDIIKSTVAIVILETPHGGTESQGNGVFVAKPEIAEIAPLEYAVFLQFARYYDDLQVVCFVEELANNYVGEDAKTEVRLSPASRFCLQQKLVA